MILCDVGNTRMHFFNGRRVEHLSHEEGLVRYAKVPVLYICVSAKAEARIVREAPLWKRLAGGVLRTDYRGLGIDREAACLGVWDGVVVDAGSAITVDFMEEGRHLGGWIWPGIEATREAYASVSALLRRPLNPKVALDVLPNDTDAAVNFGIFASVVAVVERFCGGRRVVVTGGDAQTVAALLPDSVVDETVVFRGMHKLRKDDTC